jgi:hypothetical protein
MGMSFALDHCLQLSRTHGICQGIVVLLALIGRQLRASYAAAQLPNAEPPPKAVQA